MKTRTLKLLAALVVMGASPRLASAQVTVSGSTFDSCAGSGCPANSSYFTGTTTGLSFAGNTFSVTTFDGVASLSGVNRLGVFSQAVDAGTLSGNFFLNLAFTAPSGIDTGNMAQYEGTVTGHVGSLDNGSTNVISFDPQTFYYNGGQSAFTLSVNDAFITSGRTAELQANITAAPEPASMTLLATGLLGIFGAARRRRKNVA